MQSNHLENIHSLSYSDQSVTDVKSDSHSLSTRKRRRPAEPKSWSRKEEDRILQYALKISQKEFLREQKAKEESVKLDTYEEIPQSATFNATSDDFGNFIEYVEKCWKSKECSGVMKIIPPESWVNETKKFYSGNIFPKVCEDDNKLSTRLQKLGEMYQAKVINKLI